jgi:hypothetical protein
MRFVPLFGILKENISLKKLVLDVSNFRASRLSTAIQMHPSFWPKAGAQTGDGEIRPRVEGLHRVSVT